jgi:nucleotidyltransferase/DNA polymerase involved in DNA repair
MDHVDDAVAKCPSLRLVHVDTVDEHGVCHQSSVWTADASSQSSTQSQTTAEPAITSPVEQSAAASVAPSNIPVIASSTNAAKVRVPVHAARGNEKVSLERYRHTSQRILRVFASLVGEGCIERASVDEAYIDMTECVDKHIRQMLADPSTESSSLTWHGHVFGGEFQCSPLAEADIETKLCVCDRLVAELRRRVQTEIGVTCSAGISVNKVLFHL